MTYESGRATADEAVMDVDHCTGCAALVVYHESGPATDFDDLSRRDTGARHDCGWEFVQP